ncbi:MAG: SulP family inorganic anion transporter, partial [Flavobacteriales bacterium]|nr:SulP family inorganic anion transporter [Flavobacteriales bacterium]
MRRIFNIFDKSKSINLKTELLSGMTVALALVPEAVAFAFMAGLSPLTGLYAAFVMGLITSTFGGRPGMISGATGAVAIVIIALAKSHGPEYIFATVILAGILQAIAGGLKLGKFMRLVPHPVIFGFVNGLAVIIFMSQLDQFKDDQGQWLTGSTMLIWSGLVLLTMFIIWGLPKLTKAFPSSLAAILAIFGLTSLLGLDTKTVGDVASIQGMFPPFHIPEVPFSLETLQVIFPYAAIVAGVGLIESLLTLNIIDEITGTRGNSNKEAVAQGAANILSGLFSGMGGCAMIGQSLINVSSGARSRISG